MLVEVRVKLKEISINYFAFYDNFDPLLGKIQKECTDKSHIHNGSMIGRNHGKNMKVNSSNHIFTIISDLYL